MELRIEVGTSHKTVTAQVDELAKGIAKIIAENPEWETLVAFGMLPAELMESFNKQVAEGIKKQFGWLYQEEQERIDRFISDVRQAVAKGIYSHSKMIV